MGNSPSSSGKRGKKGSRSSAGTSVEEVAARAQQVAADLHAGIRNGLKNLEENDHPAAQMIDQMCGPYLDPHSSNSRRRRPVYESSSEEESELDSRAVSEDETTLTNDYKQRKNRRPRGRHETETLESASYISQSEYDESTYADRTKDSRQTKSEIDDQPRRGNPSSAMQQPLASSFAKRCYFTKSGIGSSTQHYEGLTLTGNVVLMLAGAMKLKGCPTICDEDLRRVEQTYPNQFSRLPDELLLSSGWRRISKYCHFSGKPIPDGVPFFHSTKRLHPSGGYYFLLASAVGMIRPDDVEPLNRDTLVLLETDYPAACDAAPAALIQDPSEWTLVDRFCFFSGGPINADEDVYYQADFDGSLIFMLAFLSPSLTAEELYKLDAPIDESLQTVEMVEHVESIYDLTERDFEDLKLYHLGPCRALPPFLLQPHAWSKVLPPHFLKAKQIALQRAADFESYMRQTSGRPASPYDEFASDSREQPFSTIAESSPLAQIEFNDEKLYNSETKNVHHGHDAVRYDVPPPPPLPSKHAAGAYLPHGPPSPPESTDIADHYHNSQTMDDRRVEMHEYDNSAVPMDEALDGLGARVRGFDPPEDEPPSLKKNDVTGLGHIDTQYYVTPMDEEPRSPVTDDFASPVSMETYDEHIPSPDIGRPPKKSEIDRSKSTSPAMRGAQEMLKRNRQRRSLETAKRQERESRKETIIPEKPNDAFGTNARFETPKSPESGTTWETGSDGTSMDGSTWTDDNNPDRSSRRALILQMAKARMRNNQQLQYSPEDGSPTAESREMEEEKKNDIGQPDDIDLTGDLD
ncbi:hypothetical protein FisN_7Hh037 [Fistulifera solaris]|uniref:Uncharacterized protein n=1 Tax=Fistulifera solaris TaxID=1519565 RepID=A0A1Z5K3A4_FISSO|nr:hypothetical protein FisN_7Hh037 [Fistulifera solaris]|eukprot:GAX20727.1 hypothetical protein FisN_7Hh037 [Fistulifera solaris]